MEKQFEKKEITKKSEDFSQWYVDVVLRAGLADYAPVKGCMVIRPYGYAIWENIQKALDEKIKKTGAQNAYFPLFIPERLLKKEKEHVKGFSPELAVVTIGGGEELQEKLVIRPTSETIMYEMFSKWIQSWRDLPLMINQWCNIVRWEKRTRLFLRTTEFLWQEGHTCHASHEEALEEVMAILEIYQNLYREFFAIDGIVGKKSEAEKFAGAHATYSYEMLMPDGRALQGCTSHDLGQNFAQVFNIKFLDKEGKAKMVWQTSWGLSTRSIGALIMAHGDDQGLIVPPQLAPIQIVVVPIIQQKAVNKNLETKLMKIKETLKDFRIEIDKRPEYSVGWKFNEWELKGVPLRIEIGKKEIAVNKATLVRRDNGKHFSVSFKNLAKEVQKTLNDIQKNLLLKNSKSLKENTREATDYQEFKKIMANQKGFIKAFWCGHPQCEEKIKEETMATARVLVVGTEGKEGKCIYCGKPSRGKWIFAQAY